MTASMLIPLTLSAAALGVLPDPMPLSPPPHPASASASGPRVPHRWRRASVVAAGLLAASVLLGLGPWWLGFGVAAVAGIATLRMPDRRSAADRAADRRRLAVHADLLAACLDAGMAIGPALSAVQTAGDDCVRGTGSKDDPLEALRAVAALLMLGADPDRAWRSTQDHPDLASLAAAARRSAVGGAGLADAVREHAVGLRAATAEAATRSAGRAGVAMTAPLGLCFLPAFLCLGLAPVVVGLLSTLHLF